MARGKQPAFWGAVAGVSILSPFVLGVAVDQLRDVPGFAGLGTFYDYLIRRNG